MPSLDGGHYFFTAVVPVWNEGIVEHEGMRSSPIHMVREALETLPTALQSRESEKIGIQSPFARSLCTHFARIVVLDQPNFNGRDHDNAIVASIRETNLLDPQPVDALSCPYLLVMIDFDPQGEDAARNYCEELWRLMPDELTAVFRYCYGFSNVRDARGFADFLLACELETTMPFNDYWVGAPQLPSMTKWSLVAVPVVLLLLPIIAAMFGHIGWWMAICLAILLGVVGLVIDYMRVMRWGAQPFPAAPNSTLRDVLKALYLQQAFSEFAIQQQGRDLLQSGAAFRAFLAEHRPNDLAGPTQPPGVIRSKIGEMGV